MLLTDHWEENTAWNSSFKITNLFLSLAFFTTSMNVTKSVVLCAWTICWTMFFTHLNYRYKEKSYNKMHFYDDADGDDSLYLSLKKR